MAVALLALVATFWQAHISRKHNRLSVQPFVEHYQERIPGKHISVSIRNNGIGPALLEKVYFTISPNAQRLDIDELLDIIVLTMKPTKGEWETGTFSGKTTFPPGKMVTLIKLELTLEDDENFRIINKILDDTNIHIVYRCLYNHLYNYSEALRLA